MNENLVALELLLQELKVPSRIKTTDDRKKVQKAVYLGQLSGVDLGYRFGWYIMGPYSPGLTRDYYQLAEELEAGANFSEGKRLRKSASETLKPIAAIMRLPSSLKAKLVHGDWLELLASYHYLRCVSKQSPSVAVETMKLRKPHLVPYLDQAIEALKRAGLLAA